MTATVTIAILVVIVAGASASVNSLLRHMRTLAIPPDKVDLIQSPNCLAWVVENCPGSVRGHMSPDMDYLLTFSDEGEAEAFQQRWLTGHASEFSDRDKME